MMKCWQRTSKVFAHLRRLLRSAPLTLLSTNHRALLNMSYVRSVYHLPQNLAPEVVDHTTNRDHSYHQSANHAERLRVYRQTSRSRKLMPQQLQTLLQTQPAVFVDDMSEVRQSLNACQGPYSSRLGRMGNRRRPVVQVLVQIEQFWPLRFKCARSGCCSNDTSVFDVLRLRSSN